MKALITVGIILFTIVTILVVIGADTGLTIETALDVVKNAPGANAVNELQEVTAFIKSLPNVNTGIEVIDYIINIFWNLLKTVAEVVIFMSMGILYILNYIEYFINLIVIRGV